MARARYPHIDLKYKAQIVTQHIGVHDDPIIFVSPEFCWLTLYAREEIMGHNCRFLQGRHTSRAAIATMHDAVARGELLDIELINYRKDGTPFLNGLKLFPLFDDEGELRYHLAIQTNITIASPERPVEHWTAGEVAMWLEKRGFDSHEAVERMVSGEQLMRCTEEELMRLGIHQYDCQRLSNFLAIEIEYRAAMNEQDA